MTEFCVECGKETDRLIDGCCRDCYLKDRIFVNTPQVIDVIVCAHCGARQHKKTWVDADTPLLTVVHDAIIESITVANEMEGVSFSFEEEFHDEKNITVRVMARGQVNGLVVNEEHSVLVRTHRSVCIRCSREEGGYFEGIIQFRSRGREVTKDELVKAGGIINNALFAMRNSGMPNAFLSDYQEHHGGADYYIGDKEAARQIAGTLIQKFGGESNIAPKLVGKKEGKDVYRVTYLVRIPNYRKGDFIRWDNMVYRVISMSKDFAAIADLKHHIKKQRRHRDLEKAILLGGEGLMHDAVLLGESEGEVSIMHPKTFKTTPVIKPHGYEHPPGETISIVIIEDEVYLSP